MGRQEKLIAKILRGSSDSNLGFEERVKGGHSIFRKEGVDELINLQKDGSKAKAYQVKQLRTVLTNDNLMGEDDAEV